MIKLKIKYGNSQTDIRFPCTEKALQEALAEIGAEQVRPLELYVTEVVFPEELAFLQDRFVNLDEVNLILSIILDKIKKTACRRSAFNHGCNDSFKAVLFYIPKHIE